MRKRARENQTGPQMRRHSGKRETEKERVRKKKEGERVSNKSEKEKERAREGERERENRYWCLTEFVDRGCKS
jgi:hypothetical protein